MTTAAAADTVELHLLGTPVRVWVRASERYQDLFREFKLLQFGREGDQPAPGRLLVLSEQLTGRYSGLAVSNNAQRDQAMAAGLDRIDLTYQVPAEIREPCFTLLQLMEEVDEFCRSDQLLTLETRPSRRRSAGGTSVSSSPRSTASHRNRGTDRWTARSTSSDGTADRG